MLMRLRATRPFRYQTRQLVAGEEFDAASARDARLLLAIRKATKIRPPATVPPPPPEVAKKIEAAVAPAPVPTRPPLPATAKPTDYVQAGRIYTGPAPAPDDLDAARTAYRETFGKPS